MLKRFCLCLGLLLVSLNSPLVFAGREKEAPKPQVEKDLIKSVLMENTGLSLSWQKKFYIKNDEIIRKMFIHDKYLFVETNQNFLYCMNRHKGKFLFSIQIAAKGLPIDGPTFYGEEMLYMVGNKLHVIDLKLGRVSKVKDYSLAGKGAIFPPVRNKRFIYLSNLAGRLSALNSDETSVVFQVTSDKDSLINSVVADDDHLVFSTEIGEVVRIKTNKAEKIWQFNVGKIAAPVVRDGKWLYVGSLDRKLYKLNIEDGFGGWIVPFIAGEPLKTSPKIGKNVVYQNAGKKGLFAVDKKTGTSVWQLKDGFDLLCEKSAKSYILAKPSRLVVMDNVKGKKLHSVNFAGVSSHVVNTEDSTIYVAEKTGLVMAITIDK